MRLVLRQALQALAAKRTAIWGIFIIACLTRLTVVTLKQPAFNGRWGGEMAAIAASLASGEGFSSPYGGNTGPTAFEPPTYPFVLSYIFRLFGIYSPASAQVALVLGSILSAAVCFPLLKLGSRISSREMGVLACAFWALWPLAGYTDALFIWNTSLSVLLVTWFLAWLLALEQDSDRSRQSWLGFGLLTGFLILSEPSALTIIGVCFLWLFVRLVQRRRSIGILLAASIVAAIPPGVWVLRNTLVFHQFVFVRSGLGLQLAVSTIEREMDSAAPLVSLPNRDPREFQRYQELGELAYMDVRKQEAFAWIKAHPHEYARKVAQRIAGFWTGTKFIESHYWIYRRFNLLKHVICTLPCVGAIIGMLVLTQRKQYALFWLFLAIVTAYPLVYYFTYVELRYRAPIDPLLLALTALSCLRLDLFGQEQAKSAEIDIG